MGKENSMMKKRRERVKKWIWIQSESKCYYVSGNNLQNFMNILNKGIDPDIAEYFRIAGPGDLEKPSVNVLFLPYWLLNREELLSMVLDRSDSNAPNQASGFTLHIRELKAETLFV